MATIKKIYNPALKSPFQVGWSIDGKRYSRFFQTEEEQEKFANAMSPYIGGNNTEILNLDLPTIGDIIFVNRIREEVSFRNLWDFWAKHHKARESVTLFSAADNYIREMLTDGRVSKEHTYHMRRMLERLCETFSETLGEESTRRIVDRHFLSNGFDEVDAIFAWYQWRRYWEYVKVIRAWHILCKFGQKAWKDAASASLKRIS